jgi:hypothetical protein
LFVCLASTKKETAPTRQSDLLPISLLFPRSHLPVSCGVIFLESKKNRRNKKKRNSKVCLIDLFWEGSAPYQRAGHLGVAHPPPPLRVFFPSHLVPLLHLFPAIVTCLAL